MICVISGNETTLLLSHNLLKKKKQSPVLIAKKIKSCQYLESGFMEHLVDPATLRTIR